MAARAMSRRPQIPSVIHNLIPAAAAAAATPNAVPEPEIRGYVHPDFEPVVELFAKVCSMLALQDKNEFDPNEILNCFIVFLGLLKS